MKIEQVNNKYIISISGGRFPSIIIKNLQRLVTKLENEAEKKRFKKNHRGKQHE